MKLLVQSTYFNLGKETVSFPITVIPSPPGQYSCDIIMKAPNDVRVYHVECTLKYKDVQVELEFTSPTHQTALQNVPIVSSGNSPYQLLLRYRKSKRGNCHQMSLLGSPFCLNTLCSNCFRLG